MMESDWSMVKEGKCIYCKKELTETEKDYGICLHCAVTINDQLKTEKYKNKPPRSSKIWD